MTTLSIVASIARLHIVAIGALGALTFGWAFTGERMVWVALLAAADWFVVNLLNRVVDVREDAANGIRGTGTVARHRTAVTVIAAAVAVVSFSASALWAPATLPWRLAFHTLGAVYNWRVLPGGRRLKQLYFWKNSASATGFLLTCIALPLAAASTGLAADVSSATLFAVALFFFLFEVSYEILYDLRDVVGDAAVGARTYAVAHGSAFAWRLVVGLCVTAALVLIVGYVAGVVPWRLAVMSIAPVVQIIVARRAVVRGITSTDCIVVTWIGAGLLAAYHVWDILGLPGTGA